ncbi:protein TIC 62, chloroplastic isoform X2 [Phragmites australis]|uniref:protein TIC 62, chloroplastic isoform X2 n=1 Tax=Phragmites australis TaxID=29695 RepID=UPI002D7738DB|nr:protein TIC 62, chloroplastic isoform X2 [Phragmites australis]
MEAAKLKMGLGMDTAVSLSPLRHPSSSSACKLGMVSISRSTAANPLLLKQRSCNNSTRPSRWSRLRSSSASSSATTTTPPAQQQKEKEKEDDLVFVAGATGRVGSRAVRELIKLGFRVRAAVRNAERASSLVQSVQQLKLDDDATATSPAEKLEIVECDLEEQPQQGIVSAIGNAALVVCSIGASEKEIFDVTGPYRIDYMASNNLVQAATAANVEHFILVTSLGTNKIGFPAFLLNLFWGVLCWKRRAEEALIASGIPYTIIRPGGMERPTDAFKETHNLVVAAEDTYVGGLVSNLQVAELIGCMAKNRKAAYCKVVEVVAETTAPLLPMEQLLSTIPSKKEPPAEEVVDTAVESKPDPPAASATAKTERPLSPYTAYEGLKPPSSPSPKPSRSSSSSDDDEKLQVEAAHVASSPTSSRPLSPYTAFVDLKPPSSPSPSSSTVTVTGTNTPATSSVLLDSNANGTPINSSSNTASPSDQLQGEKKQQQQPLSPYTSYEELKPPSSPTPSAPKL